MNTIPNLNGTPGNTPLHPDDAAQLVPNLATRKELDEWERKNILAAQRWAFNSRVMSSRDPLDEIYLRELHRKMFEDTWRWAGIYRTRDVNFGCPFAEIYQRIPALLGNVRYWISNSIFPIDEIAIRFHYQLVSEIHAFPNGNGRHARMIANVLSVKYGRPRFTWGRSNLVDTGPTREAYFAALHALDANANNIRPLLEFARS
jgi:Fic-DOC domain mobile mystery protein B